MAARASKEFRQLQYAEDDGLDANGRKNAKHAEEIHDEVEKTRVVMGRFLARCLPQLQPDDWHEVCVDAAFESYASDEMRDKLPSHYDLEYYDIRCITMVLRHNLHALTFERESRVTQQEISAFIQIRNYYEHRDSHLNQHRWRNDIESIRVLRAKMQSDEEIAEETYSLSDLPAMEASADQYAQSLESLQRQIEALTNSMLGLDQRLTSSSRVDEQQFAELERRRETDEEQDEEIMRQQQTDVAHDEELERQRQMDAEHSRSIGEFEERIACLTERDARQRHEIMGLMVVSLASLAVAIVSLVRKR